MDNKNLQERSYEVVNYVLRPKKQIERKIIIDILQELIDKCDFEKYTYIGFGSIFYFDFILFHKFLNINNLQSIDDKPTNKRFEFNKPYDFIDFKNRKSTDFLENDYDWNDNTLIWLDYDCELNNVVLDDLRIIARNCKLRDFLIITIDARFDRLNKSYEDTYSEKAYNEFCELVKEYIPEELLSAKYFTPNNFPILIENVLLSYFKTILSDFDGKIFKKFFSFRYEDTTLMYTLGGFFLKPDDELCVKKFDNKFISTDDNIYDIDVPILTYREKHYIDSKIAWLKKKLEKIEKDNRNRINGLSFEEKEIELTKILNVCLDFEVPSFYSLKKYIDCYKFYPQYYEGLI